MLTRLVTPRPDLAGGLVCEYSGFTVTARRGAADPQHLIHGHRRKSTRRKGARRASSSPKADGSAAWGSPQERARLRLELLDLKRVNCKGPDALAPGKHTLESNVKYDGLGCARWRSTASAAFVGSEPEPSSSLPAARPSP
jgi:arylsulfatase